MSIINPPWSNNQPVSIVIGASGGIGTACAKILEARGYIVVPTYHKHPIEHPLAMSLSIQHKPAVEHLIASTIEKFGRIDVIVNASGILQQKPYEEISQNDYNIMIDINLTGTWNLLQVSMPIMKAQVDGGCIITMSSTGAQVGGTLAPHYVASKSGVIGLTKSFARIGAPNVRVNCVAPGLIDGEMSQDEINSTAGKIKIRNTPLQRTGTPEEVAHGVMFLIENRYITGQILNINGGSYLG